MPQATIPAGWTYDAPDYSVGIMTGGWLHDDCEYGEVTDKVVDNKRDDATGQVTLTVELTCTQCGATAHVTDYDYDPVWEGE